jgi:hypothetical protein
MHSAILKPGITRQLSSTTWQAKIPASHAGKTACLKILPRDKQARGSRRKPNPSSTHRLGRHQKPRALRLRGVLADVESEPLAARAALAPHKTLE